MLIIEIIAGIWLVVLTFIPFLFVAAVIRQYRRIKEKQDKKLATRSVRKLESTYGKLLDIAADLHDRLGELGVQIDRLEREDDDDD